jgi:hypothetical protein
MDPRGFWNTWVVSSRLDPGVRQVSVVETSDSKDFCLNRGSRFRGEKDYGGRLADDSAQQCCSSMVSVGIGGPFRESS